MTFGKNKVSAIFALLALIAIVLGCNATKPDTPSESDTQNLVKASISDLADGINSGDFKTFREKASKDFQSQFTEDAVKTAFKSYIDKKEQVVPLLKSVSGMTAKFTAPPSIREEKGNYILVANGSFDTKPVATGFTSEYVWRDSSWKLLKLYVSLQ